MRVGTTLRIFSTEEFLAVLLNAGNLKAKHLFLYGCVLPVDGKLRAETCSSLCVVMS